MKGSLQIVRNAFVCAVALGLATAARAQDPSQVAPKSFAEKLNNDQVQVFEYHSKPGDMKALIVELKGPSGKN